MWEVNCKLTDSVNQLTINYILISIIRFGWKGLIINMLSSLFVFSEKFLSLANIFNQVEYSKGKLQTNWIGEAANSRLYPYLKY